MPTQVYIQLLYSDNGWNILYIILQEQRRAVTSSKTPYENIYAAFREVLVVNSYDRFFIIVTVMSTIVFYMCLRFKILKNHSLK